MFIISGGGSGIGRALALALARRDKIVLILGRREEKLQEVANVHQNIDYMVADVAKHSDRLSLVERVKDLPVLEGLVNNAGLIEPLVPLAEITEQTLRTVMATNLEAPLFLSQCLAPQLKTGRILNIGSGAAYFPVKAWAPYCISKAALAMLTRCQQLESDAAAYAAVMPGIIDTNMQSLIRHAVHMDPQKLDFFIRLQAQNRLLTAETVASFLTWLLLDLDRKSFVEQEWDIYDVHHHSSWLRKPHQVPSLDE